MRLRFGPQPIATTFEGPWVPAIRLGDFAGEAREALRLAVAALAEAEAVAWVTYGTLLGLVREGRQLPHDNDIDLAVMAGADTARITAAMAACGLERQFEQVGPAGMSKQKFKLGPVMIDLFYVRQEGAMLVDYCTLLRRSLLRSTHLPAVIETRMLDGLLLPVPRDAEAHLMHLYGPGWRQPVTTWHWYLSPPNAEIIAHWSEATGLLERLWRWRRRLRREAAASGR